MLFNISMIHLRVRSELGLLCTIADNAGPEKMRFICSSDSACEAQFRTLGGRPAQPGAWIFKTKSSENIVGRFCYARVRSVECANRLCGQLYEQIAI
jgi:hypothetical protein